MLEDHLPLGAQKSSAHVDSPPRIGRSPQTKAIALYLPQFHPIPANDANWGEGFTEWRNVVRGQVEFTEHYQPRIPANYGFYDLRLSAIQVRQARDAKAAGITAFAHYYYWFDGETPLVAPIVNHRDNPDIELPFCLCFANENWTKRWDGLDDELIYEQKYGDDFANRFWRDAEPFLKSDKYLKDNSGRPILLVYRPSIIPKFESVADTWQGLARGAGFPGVHLIGCLGFENLKSLTKGLDSFYEFPPLNTHARALFGPVPPQSLVHGRLPHSQTHTHDYRQFVMMERLPLPRVSNIHPGVMPAWDNVARRPFAGNAFSNVRPTVFEEWTMRAARRAKSTDDKILFVNAWNEWAEGAYLEPDVRYGWASLDAFSRGIMAADSAEKAEDGAKQIAIFVHVHYPEIWPEVRSIIEERLSTPFHMILTTTSDVELNQPKSDSLCGFEVHRVTNRGRDILPFLIALERTKLDFDIGLKLHTKRSPHRVDGAIWRRMLFDDLLPKKGCESIVSLFREDPNLGFVAPQDHWVRIGEHIGSNAEQLNKISHRLRDGFSYRDLDTGRFIAGSMFWFRRPALCGLDFSSVQDMFVEESGQLDGTAAHAIERMFSLIGERNAYVTLTSNEAEPVLNSLRNGAYPLLDRLARFSDQVEADTSATRIALSKADHPGPRAVQPNAVAVGNRANAHAQEGTRFRYTYRLAARNKYIMATYRRLPTRARVMLRRIFGLPT